MSYEEINQKIINFKNNIKKNKHDGSTLLPLDKCIINIVKILNDLNERLKELENDNK